MKMKTLIIALCLFFLAGCGGGSNMSIHGDAQHIIGVWHLVSRSNGTLTTSCPGSKLNPDGSGINCVDTTMSLNRDGSYVKTQTVGTGTSRSIGTWDATSTDLTMTSSKNEVSEYTYTHTYSTLKVTNQGVTDTYTKIG